MQNNENRNRSCITLKRFYCKTGRYCQFVDVVAERADTKNPGHRAERDIIYYVIRAALAQSL